MDLFWGLVMVALPLSPTHAQRLTKLMTPVSSTSWIRSDGGFASTSASLFAGFFEEAQNAPKEIAYGAAFYSGASSHRFGIPNTRDLIVFVGAAWYDVSSKTNYQTIMDMTPKKMEAKLTAINEALALEPEIRAAIMARKPKSMKELMDRCFEPERMKTVAFKFGHRDGRHAIGDRTYEMQKQRVSLLFLQDGSLSDDDIAPIANACATFDEAYDAGVKRIMEVFTEGIRKHIEFISHDLEVQKEMASWSPTTSSRPKP